MEHFCLIEKSLCLWFRVQLLWFTCLLRELLGIRKLRCGRGINVSAIVTWCLFSFSLNKKSTLKARHSKYSGFCNKVSFTENAVG